MANMETPAEVIAAFKQFDNVSEPWILYDSIVICPQFYGAENNIPGWFNTYAAMGGQQFHSFFKTRTEGTAGLQYCNAQSADTMDYVYLLYSIGVNFLAPSSRLVRDVTSDPVAPTTLDWTSNNFFESDLPRHVGVQFKVQQDIVFEGCAIDTPPGYGSVGFGGAWQNAGTDQLDNQHGYVCQGVPVLGARFNFPNPIPIPRTSTIEGILDVSALGRAYLTSMVGPNLNVFRGATAVADVTPWYQRAVVMMSLHGKRLVQQRGQYHV